MARTCRLVAPFIRCALVFACIPVGVLSGSGGSPALTALAKHSYLGCFVATSSEQNIRAGMRFQKSYRIASPTTKHQEYYSKMVDKRAVAEARKTGLDTSFTVGTYRGKYKLVDLGCAHYCQFLTVVDAKDMIPAGIAYCKSLGTRYAAFISGGQTLYCGNEYGIGGLADKASCSSNSTENAPVMWNGVKTAWFIDIPCGSILSTAVYSTGAISFVPNSRHDAKLTKNWLSEMTITALLSKQDGLVTIPRLDTGKSKMFEVVISGKKAEIYCKELLHQGQKKSCRLHVAFMDRTVRIWSKLMVSLLSRKGLGNAKQKWTSRGGRWHLFARHDKNALSKPSKEVGQPDNCINTKTCSPVGLQCARRSHRCRNSMYNVNLAQDFGMFGQSKAPQNYHKGMKASSSVQLSPDTVGLVALLNSQLCSIM